MTKKKGRSGGADHQQQHQNQKEQEQEQQYHFSREEFIQDWYKILEVSEGASKIEIRESYKRLSKIWHPDKNPDGKETFQMINKAHEILGDDEKRQQYDKVRALRAQHSLGPDEDVQIPSDDEEDDHENEEKMQVWIPQTVLWPALILLPILCFIIDAFADLPFEWILSLGLIAKQTLRLKSIGEQILFIFLIIIIDIIFYVALPSAWIYILGCTFAYWTFFLLTNVTENYWKSSMIVLVILVAIDFQFQRLPVHFLFLASNTIVCGILETCIAFVLDVPILGNDPKITDFIMEKTNLDREELLLMAVYLITWHFFFVFDQWLSFCFEWFSGFLFSIFLTMSKIPFEVDLLVPRKTLKLFPLPWLSIPFVMTLVIYFVVYFIPWHFYWWFALSFLLTVVLNCVLLVFLNMIARRDLRKASLTTQIRNMNKIWWALGLLILLRGFWWRSLPENGLFFALHTIVTVLISIKTFFSRYR